MKSVYLIVGLLMLSIFAGSFALAENDDTTSVSVSEVESFEIGINEIANEIASTNRPEKDGRIGFPILWKGHGWIENENSGYLISGIFIKKKFISEKSDLADPQISQRYFGRLHIIGQGNYKLVEVKEESVLEEDSLELFNPKTFYVIPMKINIEDKEDLGEYSIGTLYLENKKRYGTFSKWEGKLEIDNGELQDSWNVELGLKRYVINSLKDGSIQRLEKSNSVSNTGEKNSRELYGNANSVDNAGNVNSVDNAGNVNSVDNAGNVNSVDNAGNSVDNAGNSAKVPFWKRFWFWKRY